MSNDDAIEALRVVMKLVAEGDLVRNTDNDADAMLFMKQGMRIVGALSQAKAVLVAVEAMELA